MITVAMITRNEEGAVGKVVREIRSTVPDAEILIVDSSDDRTAEIARTEGAKVIRQFPARGYGLAMDLALRSAAGDVVVTLDCDDTYPVDRIPLMAQMVLDEGYDLVDACRLPKKPAAMPWINYVANWGFAMLASALFRRRLRDLHSGMRAYRKSMLDELSFDTKHLALPVELLLKPVSMGYRMGAVFIDYRMRIGESKMQPLAGAWWTLRRILRTRFS